MLHNAWTVSDSTAQVRLEPKERSAADLLRSASDTPHRLPSSRLGKLSSHEALPAVRRAALEHNLAFAPDDYEHGSRPSSWSGANSLLAVFILKPLENGASLSDALKADLADWVIANIYLPKDAENQLAEASAGG